MKVSREQVAANRRRILDAARRLFRERGIVGVSVAEVMQAAKLTHGAFYGYFGSKDDLLAQAFDDADQSTGTTWDDKARRAYLDRYLSDAHRDDPGDGCVFAALSHDAATGAPRLRGVMTSRLERFVAALSFAADGTDAATRRRNAAADVATIVGAVVLARLADEPALSDEILAAARTRLLATGDPE
ncbi:TetR/AcrR family transcriptional regulator [Beijerinckia sp. L45]|uniref:TetR/AcrR family transcriptional regulator n=1 Tax=Beijerinckia sp. L45 TaxID=1641855 RepID=UPI00131E7EF7|nr:TetR/AcrR family transcriptional regulator [Beijerinckia sp. L45]